MVSIISRKTISLDKDYSRIFKT